MGLSWHPGRKWSSLYYNSQDDPTETLLNTTNCLDKKWYTYYNKNSKTSESPSQTYRREEWDFHFAARQTTSWNSWWELTWREHHRTNQTHCHFHHPQRRRHSPTLPLISVAVLIGSEPLLHYLRRQINRCKHQTSISISQHMSVKQYTIKQADVSVHNQAVNC